MRGKKKLTAEEHAYYDDAEKAIKGINKYDRVEYVEPVYMQKESNEEKPSTPDDPERRVRSWALTAIAIAFFICLFVMAIVTFPQVP